MLLVTITRSGLRLAFCVLRRGVLGQNLESIVSLGGRLIGFDLIARIRLLTFTVLDLLSNSRFRHILAKLLHLGCGIRHESQLLQRLLDLLAVIRCRVGRLRRRWND